MSLSSEYFHYHLTPHGWVEGTEQLDFGGTERPVPPDRVMTLIYHERLSSIYSRPERSMRVDWRHPDVRLVERLKARFGPPPHWDLDKDFEPVQSRPGR